MCCTSNEPSSHDIHRVNARFTSVVVSIEFMVKL